MFQKSQDEKLLEAVREQKLESVKLLLQQGVSPNGTQHEVPADRPLVLAAERGDIEVMTTLLDAGADLELASSYGETPLSAAASCNRVDTMQWLLERGVNPEGEGKGKLMALERAINLEAMEAFQWLLSHDINVLQRSAMGKSLVHFAISQNALDMLKDWVASGLKLDDPQLESLGDLFRPAAENGSWEMFSFLYDNGARLNTERAYLHLLLRCAASGGNLRLFRFILDLGVDPHDDADLPFERLVTCAASYRGSVELMSFLVENLQMPLEVEGHLSPLVQAALDGHIEIVDYLLSQGVDKNAYNEEGKTSLIMSVCEHDDELFELLMTHQVDVGFKDQEGETALHHAVSGHYGANYAMATALIASGADIHAENRWGNTPLHHAVSGADSQVICCLLEAGANPGHLNHDRESPLTLALEMHDEIDPDVLVLLQRGRAR